MYFSVLSVNLLFSLTQILPSVKVAEFIFPTALTVQMLNIARFAKMAMPSTTQFNVCPALLYIQVVVHVITSNVLLVLNKCNWDKEINIVNVLLAG